MKKTKYRHGNSEFAAQGEPVPSRSAKKRASIKLQKLGEALTDFSSIERKELNLPEELEEALQLYERITDREGKRRQKQFIGRLMRSVDVGAIENALADRQNARASQMARFHRAERLRNDLLNAPEDGLSELVEKVVGRCLSEAAGESGREIVKRITELCHLARRQPGGKSSHYSRELFRAINQLLR